MTEPRDSSYERFQFRVAFLDRPADFWGGFSRMTHLEAGIQVVSLRRGAVDVATLRAWQAAGPGVERDLLLDLRSEDGTSAVGWTLHGVRLVKVARPSEDRVWQDNLEVVDEVMLGYRDLSMSLPGTDRARPRAGEPEGAG